MHYACQNLIILCIVEKHLPLDLSTHRDHFELIKIYLRVTLDLESLEHILKCMYMVWGTTTHNLIGFQESIRVTQTPHFM